MMSKLVYWVLYGWERILGWGKILMLNIVYFIKLLDNSLEVIL